MGEEWRAGAWSIDVYAIYFITVMGFWLSTTEYGNHSGFLIINASESYSDDILKLIPS